MAYRRPVRYEPGETLIACSICGFPRLYPSELRRLDDRLFYCDRHVEYHSGKTALTDQRETAQEQRKRDTETIRLNGPVPSWRDGD